MRVRGPTIATFLAEAEESLALLGSQLKKSHSDVRRGVSLGRGERRRPLLSHPLVQSPEGASPRAFADAATGHTQNASGSPGLDSGELSRSMTELLEREEDVKEQLAVQAKTLLRVDRRLQALECRSAGPEACGGGEGGPSGTNPGLGSPRDVKDFCEQQFQRLQAETRQHVEDLGKSLRQWLADTESGLQVVWEQHLARDRVEDVATCMTQSTSTEEHLELPEKLSDRPAPAAEEADPANGIVEEGHLPGQLLAPAPPAAAAAEADPEEHHATAADAAQQLLAAGQDHVADVIETPAAAVLESSEVCSPSPALVSLETCELDGTSACGDAPVALCVEASAEAPADVEMTPPAEAISEEPKAKLRASAVLVGVQDPNALKPPSPGRCSPVIPVVRRRNYDSLFNFAPSDRDHGASSSLFHGRAGAPPAGSAGTDTPTSESMENLRRGLESLGLSWNAAAAGTAHSGPSVDPSNLSEELAEPPGMDREAPASTEHVSEKYLAEGSESHAAPAVAQSEDGGDVDQAQGEDDHFQEEAVPALRSPSSGSEPNAAPAVTQSEAGGDADQAKGEDDQFQQEAVPAPCSPSSGSTAPASPDRAADGGPPAPAGAAAPGEASGDGGRECAHPDDHEQLLAGVEGNRAAGATDAHLAAADALSSLAAWPGRADDNTLGQTTLEDVEVERPGSSVASADGANPVPSAETGGLPAGAGHAGGPEVRRMDSDDEGSEEGEGSEASSDDDLLPMSTGLAGSVGSADPSSPAKEAVEAPSRGTGSPACTWDALAQSLATGSVGLADRSSPANEAAQTHDRGMGDPASAWDTLAQSIAEGSVGPADRSSPANEAAETHDRGMGDAASAWDALAQSIAEGSVGPADHSSPPEEAAEAPERGMGDPASAWDALAQSIAGGSVGPADNSSPPEEAAEAPEQGMGDPASAWDALAQSIAGGPEPRGALARARPEVGNAAARAEGGLAGSIGPADHSSPAKEAVVASDKGMGDPTSAWDALAQNLSTGFATSVGVADHGSPTTEAVEAPGRETGDPASAWDALAQSLAAGTQRTCPADTPQLEVEDLSDVDAGPAVVPAVVAPALSVPAAGTQLTSSADTPQLEVEDFSDDDAGPAPAVVAPARSVPAAGSPQTRPADAPQLEVEDVSDDDAGPAQVPALVTPASPVPAAGTPQTSRADAPQLEVEDVSDDDAGPARGPALATPASSLPVAGTPQTCPADAPQLEVEDVSDDDAGPAQDPALVTPAPPVPAAGAQHASELIVRNLDSDDEDGEASIAMEQIPTSTSRGQSSPRAGPAATGSSSSSSASSPRRRMEVELHAKPQLVEVAGGWNGNRPDASSTGGVVQAFPAAASSSSSSGDSSDEGASSADESPSARRGGAHGGPLLSGRPQDADGADSAPCTVDTFAAAVASSMVPGVDSGRAGRPPCTVDSFSAAVASTLAPAAAADGRPANGLCLDDVEHVSSIGSTE